MYCHKYHHCLGIICFISLTSLAILWKISQTCIMSMSYVSYVSSFSFSYSMSSLSSLDLCWFSCFWGWYNRFYCWMRLIFLLEYQCWKFLVFFIIIFPYGRFAGGFSIEWYVWWNTTSTLFVGLFCMRIQSRTISSLIT